MTQDQLNRIKRGMALLDQKAPGWREKINLDVLNMAWCEECILGQIFGVYLDGLEELEIANSELHDELSDEVDDMAISLGFQAALEEGDYRYSYRTEYESLTEAWKEVLRGDSNDDK